MQSALLAWYAANGATCPGERPATRTRSSSARSCCSRPRSRGSSSATSRGSSAGRLRARPGRRDGGRRSARLGGARLQPARAEPAGTRRGAWSSAGWFPRRVEALERCRASARTRRARSRASRSAPKSRRVDANVRRVLQRALGTTDVAPPAGRASEWNAGAVRPRRDGLPGARPALRALPAGGRLPVARPALRAGAPPGPVRGLAPPGAAAAARRELRAGRAATATHDGASSTSLLARRPAWPSGRPRCTPERHDAPSTPRTLCAAWRARGRALPDARATSLADVGLRALRGGARRGRQARRSWSSRTPRAAARRRRRRSSPRWPRPTRCCLVRATTHAGEVDSFRKPLYAARAETGTRVAFGAHMDDACWSTRWRRTTARCASAAAAFADAARGRGAHARDDAGGHGLHVRRRRPRAGSVDDGVIDARRFANLPAGEIFIAPLEDAAPTASACRPLDRASTGWAWSTSRSGCAFERRAHRLRRGRPRSRRRPRARSRRPARAPTSSPSSASAPTSGRASRATSSPTRRCSARRTWRSATTPAQYGGDNHATIHVDGEHGRRHHRGRRGVVMTAGALA